jgi:hypothetical protein
MEQGEENEEETNTIPFSATGLARRGAKRIHGKAQSEQSLQSNLLDELVGQLLSLQLASGLGFEDKSSFVIDQIPSVLIDCDTLVPST